MRSTDKASPVASQRKHPGRLRFRSLAAQPGAPRRRKWTATTARRKKRVVKSRACHVPTNGHGWQSTIAAFGAQHQPLSTSRRANANEFVRNAFLTRRLVLGCSRSSPRERGRATPSVGASLHPEPGTAAADVCNSPGIEGRRTLHHSIAWCLGEPKRPPADPSRACGSHESAQAHPRPDAAYYSPCSDCCRAGADSPVRPRGGRAGGHICLTARGVRGHAGARRAYRTHALCVRHVREMCAASARRGALCADLQRPRLHSRARAGESPGPGRALHTCARPSRAHSPCRPALSGGPEAGLARRARQALCRVRPSECQAKPGKQKAVWASFTNFKRFASRPAAGAVGSARPRPAARCAARRGSQPSLRA